MFKKLAQQKLLLISIGLVVLAGSALFLNSLLPSSGFIDNGGKLVIELPADTEAGEFHDGLAPRKSGISWGYIDHRGAWVIPPQFLSARNFSEGLAAVFVRDKKKFAYIDKKARGVIELEDATAVGDFHEGIAMVAKGDLCGYIDDTGKFVIPQIYRYVAERNSSYGVIPVALMFKDKSMPVKWTFVNHNNKPVIPEVFDGAKEINDGMAPVMINLPMERDPNSKGAYWGFLNGSAKDFAIKPEYADAAPFSEGLAAVTFAELGPGKTASRTYIDASNHRLPMELEFAGPFSEGLAAAGSKTGQGLGYIDKNGKYIIAPRFAVANKFSEGLAFTVRKGFRPFWEAY